MIKYLKYSSIISIGLLLGRFIGFIREIILAKKFGISEENDQLILILTAPDLINNIISASTISLILIPYFQENKNKINILKEIFYPFITITIFLYFSTTIIYYKFYNLETFILLSISLVSIFPNILTGIYSAYYQFEEKFIIPSLTNFIFNTVIIFSLIFYFNNIIFAITIIFASLIRFLFVYYKSNLKFKNRIIKSTGLKIKSIIIVFLSYGLIYTIPVIDKMFAYKLEEGQVSLINFAEKIYLFPCVIILSTFSTAIFPNFTKLFSKKKINKLRLDYTRGLLIIFSLSILLSILLFFFGNEFIKIVYFMSNFSKSDINDINTVLRAFTGVILSYGTLSLVLSLLYAIKAYIEIILVSLFIIIIKIILNYYIILNNGDSFDLALGSSILMILSSLFYLFTSYKKLSKYQSFKKI